MAFNYNFPSLKLKQVQCFEYLLQGFDVLSIQGPFLKMEGEKWSWHRLLSSTISLVYNLTQLIYSKPYICILSAWRKNYDYNLTPY